MAETANVDTWETLKAFGFTPDEANVLSEFKPALRYDFGNFTLSAGAMLGKWFQPVILFQGILSTPRTLADVCFELPRAVASSEQLAAFLAYYLDNASSNGFHPLRDAGWLHEGRRSRALLPWEVERARYSARPRCHVRREWLRLALSSLSEIISGADDAALVSISFDGSVLSVRCGQVVPMPAEGEAWASTFEIPAGHLRNLPKRLLQPDVEVSVYDGVLRIGGRPFEGVTEEGR